MNIIHIKPKIQQKRSWPYIIFWKQTPSNKFWMMSPLSYKLVRGDDFVPREMMFDIKFDYDSADSTFLQQ